ncbi:AMP-binding protein [Scleromatobacter humisilvae]|uniref:AMP-binding protein n=1 Tax=Scleromatobacter humisilvae TaxID=2897159 RepID=A0A9X1YEU2_9BURK|nr:AMP-binding protein [Scleromatobacter humisilvae]MCK9684297.1 AMP-binding protein [Scleromatobacter humisilvae]
MADAAGWRPLTGLPRAAASTAVAWRACEPLSAADFAGQAGAWRDLLATQGGTRWALFAEDTFDFAAALFGAWHAGKTVIVPGDMQDDTVARLRADCDGFLGDLPGALARPAPARAAAFEPLDRAATQLIVHTSGTSGEPLAIPKRLAQLDAEVHALELRFGTLCDTGLAPVNLAPETVAAGDAVAGLAREADGAAPLVWATVTHQHIYGLLFRVLWPLAAGRPFAAERLAFNEEIAQRIASPAVLVASPAHLRRLPEAADWSAARANLRAVFSSGGPLPPEAADSALALLGCAPVEVYGSSETGGVAWRQRARHGDTWQPLPGIAFRIEDGELSVRSPHLPDLDWWRTSDRATPAGDGMDGFELHGRADRIVKIEEKRVSLTAIERRLAGSGDVAEARVLMLADEPPVVDDAGAAVAHALRPAVVAALTEAGRAKLRRVGKPALSAELRALLLAAVDRVALPRRWRFVDALPVNAQGKTTEALLGALFAPPVAARPQRPTPRWRIAEAAHAQASLALSSNLLVFDGHFPGAPILPGVAQVDWAIVFARQRFAMPARFIRMDALKFSQPALPGMTIDLELHWNAATATLQFEYRSTAGRHSSGRIVFAEAGAA